MSSPIATRHFGDDRSSRGDTASLEHRRNDPREVPSALTIFARLASTLLGAEGWMLLQRHATQWGVISTHGVPPELQASLLSERTSEGTHECGLSAGVAVLDASSRTGHILDVRIGVGEAPRYRCVLIRGNPSRPFRGREIEALVRTLSDVTRLLVLEERLRIMEASAERQLVAAHTGFRLLDMLGADICVLDQDLRPLLASKAITGRNELRLRDGSISAASPDDDRRLRAELVAALDNDDGAAVRGLSLGPDEARRPAVITTFDIEAHGSTRRIAALLLPRQISPDCDPGLIRSMFGLSRVEATIVKLLYDGQAPNEAAEKMHMSQNTLRHYLKVIFRKLNVHRQSELVRLISATAGLVRGAGRGGDAILLPAATGPSPLTPASVTPAIAEAS